MSIIFAFLEHSANSQDIFKRKQSLFLYFLIYMVTIIWPLQSEIFIFQTFSWFRIRSGSYESSQKVQNI